MMIPTDIPSNPVRGYIHYNHQLGIPLYYDGTNWQPMGRITPKWRVVDSFANGDTVVRVEDVEIHDWIKTQPLEDWYIMTENDNFVLSPNLFSFFKLKFS